jgi:hypothetical protein
MKNPWPTRLAEAGVAVCMMMLLFGVSSEARSGSAVALAAALGLLAFGLAMVILDRKRA